MKSFIAVMTGLCLSVSTWAQTTDVKVKDLPTDGETTISISKGKNTQQEFQITEGTADISGEPEILDKEARKSWRAECNEWKKELKETNKDNIVIAMNCNNPECSKNATSQTVCKSEATYKVKTRIR